jgi:L-lactate dehydrogenase (cytochrome)
VVRMRLLRLNMEHGVSGIIVSNHGGRQETVGRMSKWDRGARGVVGVLKHYRVRDKLEVYVDGGFRRGSDVVKALCIGNDGDGLGRRLVPSFTEWLGMEIV